MTEWTEEKIIENLIKHYEAEVEQFDPDNQFKNGLTVLDCIDNFIYYDILCFCGCGIREEAKKVILTALESCSRAGEDDGYEYRMKVLGSGVYDSPLWLFVYYTLDSFEFIDHGASIAHSWLTELGEMYLWVLRNQEKEGKLAFYVPFTNKEEYERNGYKRAVADVREAIKRYGDLPFEFDGKMYYITDDPLWQKMKVDLMQVA